MNPKLTQNFIVKVQNLFASWKKLTTLSTNRRIFSAAILVGFLTGFVKLTAFIKELLVAWKFGTGDAVDAFLIALVVPSFVFNVLADSSLSAAFIPNYIKLLEKEGKKEAQKLLSGVLALVLGLLSISAVTIIVTAPFYLPWIAAGFDENKLTLTYYLLCIIALGIVLDSFVVIWSAVLNARESFALAAFSPIIVPGITILFLLQFDSWGVFALAAGLIAGAIFQILVLAIALIRQRISLIPKLSEVDVHLRQTIRQYLPAIVGAFLICSSGIVDQSMAAMLSPGSVASLNYGYRVISSPIGLISTALTTAIVPYLSKMIASRDWRELSRTVKRYIQLIFLSLFPAMVLMILFSEAIVRLVFQRGSFTVEDTHLVSQIQICYAFEIPFFIGNVLLLKLIILLRENHILILITTLNLILNITFNYLFMQWFGIQGIALSTSCGYIFSFVFMLIFTRKKIKHYISNT